MARTRANDYEQKQRNILDAAALVLARLGPEKASMSVIAREAGSSKALLYHYYSSKDALIYDIIETHLTELDCLLLDVDHANASAEERLQVLVLSVLQHYRESDAKHQVLLTCMSSLNPAQTEQVRSIERLIVKRFSTVLVQVNPSLAARATSRGRHLMPVTMSLFGMLNWMYTWFRDDGAMSREQYGRLVTSLFLDGVNGLG